MSTRREFFKKTLGVAAVAVVGKITEPQTSGPFIPDDFPFREPDEGQPYLKVADSNADLTIIDGATGTAPQGQILYLRGRVLDQNGGLVVGANVYLWQADDNGHYNHAEDPNVHSAEELDAGFQYRGIASTNSSGEFQFKTIKPKYYPLDANDPSAPVRTAHLHISVMHPKCDTLITQTYFDGDVLEDIERIRQLNQNDIILSPRGQIRPELQDLIVTFKADESVPDGPVGVVELTVRRRK